MVCFKALHQHLLRSNGTALLSLIQNSWYCEDFSSTCQHQIFYKSVSQSLGSCIWTDRWINRHSKAKGMFFRTFCCKCGTETKHTPHKKQGALQYVILKTLYIYFGPRGNDELRIHFLFHDSNRCNVTPLHMVQTGQCQNIRQQNSLKP